MARRDSTPTSNPKQARPSFDDLAKRIHTPAGNHKLLRCMTGPLDKPTAVFLCDLIRIHRPCPNELFWYDPIRMMQVGWAADAQEEMIRGLQPTLVHVELSKNMLTVRMSIDFRILHNCFYPKPINEQG